MLCSLRDILFKILLFSNIFLINGDTADIVNTSVGTIQGTKIDNFIAYLGVPYGTIDEKKPFGPAVPPSLFTTTYLAVTDPPVCPQMSNGSPKGNIQCLKLNIYTPLNVTSSSKLPVILYIHGGAFVNGDGNLKTMSPTFLIRHNVIVVTVNYRLGLYGNLCLPELGYSNQGLKDIIQALKWVKTNINSFGGDGENIVASAHSSGAASLDYILLYNEEQLFKKAIIQSAQAVIPYADGNPLNATYVAQIAKRLGINTKGTATKHLMKKLSAFKVDSLVNITSHDTFIPCIDDKLITKTLNKFKDLNGVKIMVGTAINEMLFFYNGNKNSYLSKFKIDLNRFFNNLPNDAVDLIKATYLKDNATDDEIKQSVDKFGEDFVFNYPAKRAISYYLEHNAQVYRYVFSYDGGHNYIKAMMNLTGAGATHGDELGYIYDMHTPNTPRNAADQYVTDVMSTLWTNFAKYGNPTPEETELTPVIWPQVNGFRDYFVNISSSLSIHEGPHAEKMDFWNEYFKLFGDSAAGISLGEVYTGCGEPCDH